MMQGNILFYVIGGVIAVGIIVAIVFIVKRNNNIKKNGVEADAVVSRIMENETINDTEAPTTAIPTTSGSRHRTVRLSKQG
ncbi:hypothetical protein [Ruminococcus sp.]|uniref:hypothetical protein n=1 Tax=Ruminococcus sp. TaxID=41978 RepID=UPI00386B0FD9